MFGFIVITLLVIIGILSYRNYKKEPEYEVFSVRELLSNKTAQPVLYWYRPASVATNYWKAMGCPNPDDVENIHDLELCFCYGHKFGIQVGDSIVPVYFTNLKKSKIDAFIDSNALKAIEEKIKELKEGDKDE
jgi:hypothetical protein